MDILIKIEDFIFAVEHQLNERIENTYWPQYHGWLAEKLASYDPFAVLTAATSFAVFFFLILYWAKNR